MIFLIQRKKKNTNETFEKEVFFFSKEKLREGVVRTNKTEALVQFRRLVAFERIRSVTSIVPSFPPAVMKHELSLENQTVRGARPLKKTSGLRLLDRAGARSSRPVLRK